MNKTIVALVMLLSGMTTAFFYQLKAKNEALELVELCAVSLQASEALIDLEEEVILACEEALKVCRDQI